MGKSIVGPPRVTTVLNDGLTEHIDTIRFWLRFISRIGFASICIAHFVLGFRQEREKVLFRL